jgi:bifunctional NMN adenylyltransferase/nudix hydrolase
MALYEYEYIIFICRAQPCHAAHIEIIKSACKKAQKVIILIGSAKQPLTIKNPWTWEQRVEMISLSLEPEEVYNIEFRPLQDDIYNNQRWVTQVQRIVEDISNGSNSVGMIGHTKDDTSFYLQMFPQWNHIEMSNINDLHATDIRKALFELDPVDFSELLSDKLPENIHDYLKAWMYKPEYEQLRNEYVFIKDYKSAWDSAPYEPVFVTVDAVIIQSGHVLLIKRRAEPGKNLWALVGGFINPNELLEDAMIRELREETKIKVPDPVLRGNIKDIHVFDAPKRSLRGRTITHAYHIELPPGELPKVKGSDDAIKAKWVPLSTVYAMRDQMFEDHINIINYFVGD